MAEQGQGGVADPLRIVVVSHEARRTGAPRVAVEIVRGLRAPDRTVECVLRAGGPLAADLGRAADRLSREPLARARALARRAARLRPMVDRVDELVAWLVLRRRRPALAYLNTVKSVSYVRPALRLGVPVVLHVHELEPLASSTLRRCPIGPRWRDVRLVACSDAAATSLAGVLDVPRDDVAVIPSPVDVAGVVAAGRRATGLGTGPSSGATGPARRLVVGACGYANRRKGVDLWLDVAREVRERRPDLPVDFCWVGRSDGIDGLGDAAGAATFVGEVADPYPLLAGLDVFTLPSREDPFPLVVLEAMALARAIVAFEVGGVRQQLGDAGELVAPGDVEAMADAVVGLLDDSGRRRRLGEAAAERVRACYDVGAFHPEVRRIVAAALSR
jgi:glycosyltransferase involved in cell wall biosynthesis